MLFHFFLLMQNSNLTELPNEISFVLMDLSTQLVHFEHVCGNSHVRERIIEIAFLLPIPFTPIYGASFLRIRRAEDFGGSAGKRLSDILLQL